MNQTEILNSLNLIGNKHTNNYASKLFKVYSFLHSISIEIENVKIESTGHTINECGNLINPEKLQTHYIDRKLSTFEANDKNVQELIYQIGRKYSSLASIRDLLWKKRKNKDNSELENEKTELENKIKELKIKKDELIKDAKDAFAFNDVSENEKREVAGLFEGALISVFTKNGQYIFYLPMHNKFYYLVCDLLGLKYEIKGVESMEVINTITINPAIFKTFGKAIKFVSKDDLRPAMMGICLTLENYSAEVVATDAHRLYYSPKFECSQKDRLQLIINQKAAAMLAKTSFTDDILEISILKGNKILIDGNIIELIDANFPDYRVVLPNYKTFMEFEKKPFIENVKAVLPMANKSTSQITFHLNGSISLNTRDVDFSFESNKEMPYISKNFQDTDIAFNGKFLLEAMGIFKESKLKMYSEGASNKAAVFSNGIDNILLMPLMINY